MKLFFNQKQEKMSNKKEEHPAKLRLINLNRIKAVDITNRHFESPEDFANVCVKL